MKETRQSKIKCVGSEETARQAIVMKTGQNSTQQWIFIGPEAALCKNDNDGVFGQLPHPQNGCPSLFMFHHDRVYEVMKFDEKFHSWFIEDTVQSDGSVHILTPVDPLFICLPYLEKAAEQGKYMMLDAILVSANYPSLSRLEKCLSKEALLNICSCRCTDDLVAYKLDEGKALTWLTMKVEKLSGYLQSSKINVGAGAHVSSFNRGSAKDAGECLRYAWTLVSDYLEATWSGRLKKTLGITDPVKEDLTRPPCKKQKTSDSPSDMVVEDYREPQKKTPASTKKATSKLTPSQKQLQQVDKKGMKTMSSFFSAKVKKE